MNLYTLFLFEEEEEEEGGGGGECCDYDVLICVLKATRYKRAV